MLALGILLGLFVLVVLIVLHELGHAVVASRNGVVVEEFGIGFPPRAWAKKLKNGVLFTLNWLPLGGFVRLKGEYDSVKGKGTYGQASFWAKTKILYAGVVMNWLTAALLFSLVSLWGLPKILPNQIVLPFDNTISRSELLVGVVSDGSPAESSGLKVGDELVSLNGESTASSSTLSQQTKQLAGEEVVVEYRRGGKLRSIVVELNDETKAKDGGYLGVETSQSETIRATWSAPILGVATAGQFTYETIASVGSSLGKAISGFFGQFFGDEASKQSSRDDLATVGKSVAGPIGILAVIFPSTLEGGPIQVLLMAAIISLTLAVMNILPIPALDGGRWTTMALFRLFKKKLTKEREENIQATGLLILMALMILVTWNDIGNLF